MDIKIQKMAPKFALEISKLGKDAKELQIDSNKKIYYSANTIKKLLKSDAAICLIALIDKKLAGFAIRLYHEYFNEVYLSDLFVKKEYRGTGVGKLLFLESMKLARDRNADWAWALVQVKNRKMQRFLERNGFKKGKEFNFYYKSKL